jgi:hypothetical protein
MTLLPMLDPLAEIRKLYFSTTRATIERDFARALDLLKAMDGEEVRARVTVFMHGLAQMRSDWGTQNTERRTQNAGRRTQNAERRTKDGERKTPNGTRHAPRATRTPQDAGPKALPAPKRRS